MNTDTPLPPDVPAGENPPDGAVINYFLGVATLGTVTLEIRDDAGQVVRRYSSADPVPEIDSMLAIPMYWVRPAQALSGQPGAHRFLWDLHYQPVPGIKTSYPISAVYRNTAPEATSPWVMPGRYTVVLTANGTSYTQTIHVRMDPRVKTPSADLAQQFKLSKTLYDEWLTLAVVADKINSIRTQLSDLRGKAKEGELRTLIDAVSEKLQSVGGGAESRRPDPASRLSISTALTRVRAVFNILQEADVAPTPQATAAIADLRKDSQSLGERWQAIRSEDIPALNQKLQAAGLAAIEVTH